MVINRNCVLRLSHYKNALYDLQKIGFRKVFSDNIADATGESSTRVRKDFSLFGVSGNKKGGYVVSELIAGLNDILGKAEVQKVVLVGCGKIGMALMEYRGLEKDRIEIAAGFDTDLAKIENSGAIQILPMSAFASFVSAHEIKIAVLAVPVQFAQEVVDQMVLAGIEGVLNFAPASLNTPVSVSVTNVDLGAELENLIYFTNVARRISP